MDCFGLVRPIILSIFVPSITPPKIVLDLNTFYNAWLTSTSETEVLQENKFNESNSGINSICTAGIFAPKFY